MNCTSIIDASKGVLQKYLSRIQNRSTSSTRSLGVMHGDVDKRGYYGNGQILSRKTYMDGKKHGEWKAWYNNGQL